ncbi:MAG: DNA-directed RNA polymerase subunit beta [Christensenellales bacterium]|nr:DNA-directed RNA polymerase subunit beta [Christensenellales bacterium]
MAFMVTVRDEREEAEIMKYVGVHDVNMGKGRVRKSFATIDEVVEMPDLIEVQKNSYERFLKEDLREVLNDVSPIYDFNGNLKLEFVDYALDKTPKYSLEECRERDMTYATALKVLVRLTNNETGEVKESEVFMGDFPLMTEHGTFIINGGERVIVSQLVRSPGVYYRESIDKAGKHLFDTQVIPSRGAWLEYEIDSNDVIWVRVDRARKLPVTSLLRALGYGSDEQIRQLLGNDEKLEATMQRDGGDDGTRRTRSGNEVKSKESGLMDIYRRLRPGEVGTVDSAEKLLHATFFDPKRYDMMRVGRYKYNKKLAIAARIRGHVVDQDIIDPATGEVLIAAGERIPAAKTDPLAKKIQDAGVNDIYLRLEDRVVRVIGNNFVDAAAWLSEEEIEKSGINEMVHLPTLKQLLETAEQEGMDELAKIRLLHENLSALMPKHILIDDIVASISYLLNLPYGVGVTDDIDHLGNRRLRSVGELLQNQIRIGLARLERVVRERMSVQNQSEVKPQELINIRPVSAAIKEFFGSSQLSQFMDQPNPLAELTHKRRLSALGPGGLNRDRASFEVRDVHYSHYARICPIETPEGPNIGLIGSLATYARINEYGFIEAPYRLIDHSGEKPRVLDEIVYLAADEEDGCYIAQAKEPLNPDGTFVNDRITARVRADVQSVEPSRVDYIDVSPRQVISVATAMIPFLDHDDANRALMGSNMQRQAVPLLRPEAAYVATGIEYKAGKDSGVCLRAREDGFVKKVSSDQIVIEDELHETHTYKLIKFARSNQSTCINQRPIVSAGEKIKKGDVIADGPSTDHGEIALGRNILIGFMTWEGYNYEDAVLLSEELVRNDVFTSIHLEKYECEARDTKLGAEEITRDLPNVGDDALRDLDAEGIIRVGAEVHPGDILVGKVTPKGETELTAEERLLRAIFGEKAREVRDTSLKVPHGEEGIIVDVKVFDRKDHAELAPGVNRMVRVYIAQKRKISVGDKMAGRHGNKGVVSRVLRQEDMPFLPDGTPLQIVLNPLGVPSRMNLGQVLEMHLGMAAKALGWRVATPDFDGASFEQIQNALEAGGKRRDGKTILYDGRTGDQFDNPVTVGYMYYLKLHHLVDDKMHARSTGPYSLVTQQPLGGKAQFGGQRFGEMEVWALEAYGAANTLQEILTVKSDDIVGRVKAYEAIVKGKNIPAPGVPESFKVLIKELESLCLDVKVLDSDHNEIVIKELEDEDEGYDRSQNEESESERAALPTGDDEADTDADDTEGDEGGDDFDTDDDVFDFDDVPSFEDISLDDLDDK